MAKIKYKKPSEKDIPISKSPNHLVYSLYTKQISTIKYFNLLQVKYLRIAFVIFIAVFFGIGIVMSSQNNLPFNKFSIVFSISNGGILGIIFIWYLDLVVYNKIMEAAIVNTLRLEKLYYWLPRTFQNMISIKSKGYNTIKSVPYACIIFILYGFSLLNLIANFINKSDVFLLIISVIYTLILCSFMVFMYRKSFDAFVYKN